MNKNVGRVHRNESEEIRISLQEVDGELRVELRVYSRSAHHGGNALPEPEALVIPVHVLPDLCQLLQQVQGQAPGPKSADPSSLPGLIQVEPGTPLVDLMDPSSPMADAQQLTRVPVKLPFECHLLGAPDVLPSEPGAERVKGEVRILMDGGALVWLPEQFPVRSRLAVLLRIGELTFRCQAEVVETAPQAKDGHYRHTLEWLSLHPQAQSILSKIMESAK